MAAERSSSDEPMHVLQSDEPLIGVVSRIEDGFVEQIFRSEDEADAAVDDSIVRCALALAGA